MSYSFDNLWMYFVVVFYDAFLCSLFLHVLSSSMIGTCYRLRLVGTVATIYT